MNEMIKQKKKKKRPNEPKASFKCKKKTYINLSTALNQKRGAEWKDWNARQ